MGKVPGDKTASSVGKTGAGKYLPLAGPAGIGFLLVLFVVWAGGGNADRKQISGTGEETVLVSAPSDPFYGTAKKIAVAENLGLVDEIADAVRLHPKFVILVAAPANLSPGRLLDIGRVFLDENYYPGFGIITGSTPEHAERLWARRTLAEEGLNFMAGDTEPAQRVFQPVILDLVTRETIPLNKANLTETLRKADYVYWARHTGGTSWFWNSESATWGTDDELRSGDVPLLKPVVIVSPTCSVFRPWLASSIALKFTDSGAAAYLGFVNSPHTNAFLKRGTSVPGPTSWSGFPLGLVAQVMNRSTARSVFTVPQFFMLGDPRIALSKERPYDILSDVTADNGRRVIEGTSSVNGLLSVKIGNGAEYDFITVAGSASAGVNDRFFSARLQFLDFGADRYALFPHDGGGFRIELSSKEPFGWGPADAFIDALDYSWVALWLTGSADGSPMMHAVFLPVLAAVLAYKILRRKKTIGGYGNVFIAASLFAAIRVVWFLVRKDTYSVSANFIDTSAVGVIFGGIGVFSGATVGLIVMKDAKRIVTKLTGFALIVFREFWMAGFYLLFITFMNSVPRVTGMTATGLWNYGAFLLALIPLLFETLIVYSLFRATTRPAGSIVPPLSMQRLPRNPRKSRP